MRQMVSPTAPISSIRIFFHSGATGYIIDGMKIDDMICMN